MHMHKITWSVSRGGSKQLHIWNVQRNFAYLLHVYETMVTVKGHLEVSIYLTAVRLDKVNLHQQANFCVDRSSCCRDMATFLFSKWRPSVQEAQMSQKDCATCHSSWNLVNCCITVWIVSLEQVTQGHWTASIPHVIYYILLAVCSNNASVRLSLSCAISKILPPLQCMWLPVIYSHFSFQSNCQNFVTPYQFTKNFAHNYIISNISINRLEEGFQQKCTSCTFCFHVSKSHLC